MSSEKQDWLSAASDNQGISAQQLDSLLQDPDLQQQWLRYQMIGNVIRNELPAQVDLQFADNFALLLENEEIHQLQPEPELQLAAVAATSRFGKFKSAANMPWIKTMLQGAIAASVAIVAVVGVQQSQQSPDEALTSPLPVLQTRPIGGVATPVSLSQSSVDSRFAAQQQQLQLEQQRRLQELMQARQQQIRLLEQTAQQQQKNQQNQPVVEQPPRGQ
ncbi:sigma-E factor negative regulatory protein [Rheinheimera sp.]|uniref:sigma-E factor negative regulatory protein n=1 Tax=Rheinheimera sp. TaxID=1869214 RepID=UPI002FDD2FF3